MTQANSLTRTAIVAIALTIGFYTLAVGVAVALLWGAYAQIAYDEINIRLMAFCVLGGGLILWSIVPRIDRFTPPGPRLTAEEHPELFAVLRDVGQGTGQPMPAEVYLIPDVNAYVTYRGGVMGYGSRRVMGIGLTLMQSVTVSQFRAIVAHEFGHYANDDLKFAGWIYKTRAAIDRTVNHLSEHAGLLAMPFAGYAKLFIRITQSISRAQELAADRLSAAIAGADDTIAALVLIRRAAYAYQSYFDGELGPVVSNGFRPPIAAGFTTFLHAPNVARSLDDALAHDVQYEVANIDDSHPPLRERVAALGAMPASLTLRGPRATTLLRDLDRAEAALLEFLLVDRSVAKTLKVVRWEETGTRVFVPAWQKRAAESADRLRGVTPLQLTNIVRSVTPDVAGAALAAKLHELGWMCDAMPGKPVAFTRDGRTIEPFTAAYGVDKGELKADAWQAQCREAGIDSVPLV